MQERLKDLYRLQELYLLRAFGQEFVEQKVQLQEQLQNSSYDDILNCRLCHRSKMSKPIVGMIHNQSKVSFVTQTPVLNPKGLFLQTRSAQMLQSIISNVLHFSLSDCSIFSLLKCGEMFEYAQEVEICKNHLFEQLKTLPNSVILCFLDMQALETFRLKQKDLFGKITEWNNQKIIFTHSLKTLSKNPSLKKETMQHLLLLKENL
ncbi:hypothetical protein CQA57_07370 [Helicobacter anseris]|uniref:Uracil-DNA glycosylase-like domain-containing protein n=1 Tax=Helicobacter anseris TaxID=375926 RepID=A0A3D8J3A8_9HELI|nr:uracil-DNA glycosylase family protein [Helicobacter anseris]RDU71903.1 hypothetical protein CQA57_07370 [Helicobacter anseris]